MSKSNEPTTQHRSSLGKYLEAPLRVDWLIELQLLILTFSTGIQDAVSFPDFHCFASNQTGNSVILAVGVAGLGHGLFDLLNIGVSLACFVAGAILTGQIAHFVGLRCRIWLILSNFLQTMMVFGAAIIQAVYQIQQTGPSSTGAIALLAFSSGAQVAAMRPMRIPEITTAMATAAWVDLVVDDRLFGLKNRSRDRRALFLFSLVAGSFAGAFMHLNIGSPNALIVSAVGKLLVTLLLFFNRQESQHSPSVNVA